MCYVMLMLKLLEQEKMTSPKKIENDWPPFVTFCTYHFGYKRDQLVSS